MTVGASATSGNRRILSLDVVRGVAVLGILLLNIVAFAMPTAAYLNPAAYGGAHGADLGAWVVCFLLFDGKMRGLFTMLFGASMLLVIERAEAAGQNAARVHFARNFWLLLFGLAHLWLVWWGDILSLYAPVAFVAWFLRRMEVTPLMVLGVLLLVLQFALFGLVPLGLATMEMRVAAGGADAAHAAQVLEAMHAEFGRPPTASLAAELALYRGAYPGILADRFAQHAFSPIQSLLMIGPETLGLMLIGMAGYRSGMLTGQWTRASYRRWVWIGFGAGVPLSALLAARMVQEDFSALSVAIFGLWLPTLVRPAMVLGWAALILLLLRPGGWLTTRLEAAGRMAFTNYLLTSLCMTTFFYGYGFGWFGYLSRAQLYPVVLAMWALMLLWSRPWLLRFRYGPFEWLWRTLSRGKAAPIRGGALARLPSE